MTPLLGAPGARGPRFIEPPDTTDDDDTVTLTHAFSVVPELERSRRPAIPRDVGLGNPCRIARQHHGVSLFDRDVIV